MRLSHLAFVLSVQCLSASQTAAARELVGERADYVLSGDKHRTSRLVAGGSLRAEILGAEMVGGVEAYQLRLDYDFKLRLGGRRQGSELFAIPAAYFADDFIPALRQVGRYQGANLLIEDLGPVDLHTPGGSLMTSGERLRITKLAATPADDGLDDLVFYAVIAPGIPVLGALSIDVEATYHGLPLQAGADLVAS